ncbi:MAG: penicillin acylase family protein [Kofleriaceae bacterium]|nr:penicillin acylase family protein [Kofleriaceae bacterium]
MDRRLVMSALIAVAIAACGGEDVDGPYDALPLEGDFTVGVSRVVHVARDKYGIAHIDAQTLADAAFVQGYVMAHDRLPQMDILRRYGAGTLSELFGALDPSVIDTDLEMRIHRMRPFAMQAWAQMQASTGEDDRQLVVLLQRFADGVNAYADAIRTDANPGGPWDLDPNITVSFDASRFVDWEPVDSLVLGRFQAFALSWSTPYELDLTELYNGLRETYDLASPAAPEVAARRGIAKDLMAFTPVGIEFTIPNFPNVDSETGTTSNGSEPTTTRTQAPHAATGTKRPHVPHDVMSRARAFFSRNLHTGPFGALGPHAFMRPFAGSNNWAAGGLLATDQHLQLANPSLFYPTHIVVRDIIVAGGDDDIVENDAPLDLLGVTFPGIPGIILGSNGFLAWSGTVAEHDVNDVYAETIVPCGVGATPCVSFRGTQVPVQTFTETVRVGVLGTLNPSEERTAVYELVPHHGPIIPEIDRGTHELVPRTGDTALSVAYTGHQPTFEIRAIWNLAKATSLQDGFAALDDFTYGAQNWLMMDRSGALGWTTHANVPVRGDAAYTWNAATNPDAPAPFFVLPGDGGTEWLRDGSTAVVSMSPRYIPHARDGGAAPPLAYLITANADPVGATADNDPLNGPVRDGHPLYAGVSYADGLRAARIGEMLRGDTDRSIESMARMQHDTRSTLGAKLTPYLVSLLSTLETPTLPLDLPAYFQSLTVADRARLVQARTLLAGWTYETPTGFEAGDVGNDSAATALFNAWVHFFVEGVFSDELARLPGGYDVWRLGSSMVARLVWAVIGSPQTMIASAVTGEPIVCGVIGEADASCGKVAMQALVAAMTHLESPAGYGTSDVARWAWGDKHRLQIQPLFPNTALDLPGPGLPGFPRRGDTSVVNRADAGWNDLDFSQSADGPAQRFIAVAPGDTFSERPERISVKWALPGGVIFDSRSSHYRDLLDDYYLPEKHFDAPYLREEIVRDGESRWVFR